MLAELTPEIQGAGIAVIALAAFRTVASVVDSARKSSERKQSAETVAAAMSPVCVEHAQRISVVETKLDAAKAQLRDVAATTKQTGQTLAAVANRVENNTEKLDRVLECVNGGAKGKQ